MARNANDRCDHLAGRMRPIARPYAIGQLARMSRNLTQRHPLPKGLTGDEDWHCQAAAFFGGLKFYLAYS